MTEIFMPKAGMDMKEGKLIRWLKDVGDNVEFEEPIFEIETDKITMEVESPATGVLLAKFAEEDDIIPILHTIGFIGEAGEEIPESAIPSAPITTQKEEQGGHDLPVAQRIEKRAQIAATPYAKSLASKRGINLADIAPNELTGVIRASDVPDITPLAKRVAEIDGVSLSSTIGSGFSGKITKADVLKSAKDDGLLRVPISPMRKIIGDKMLRSHQQIPAVTQFMKVDVTELLELRQKFNKKNKSKVSINDFIIKATALALTGFPNMRTRIEEDTFIICPNINIGFAVSVDDGLLVPVVKNANKLDIKELSVITKNLSEKARSLSLQPDDMAGGVFTISNMGMYDVYAFNPVINPPESGILGVAGIEDNLALVNGEVMVKKIMMICLTYDHRISDGVIAAKFQLRIRELLENPTELT